MAKLGAITFTGKSETPYDFTAYSRDTAFKKLGAVYFMTKRTKANDGGISHYRVYVGETGDLSGRPLNHHRKDCFDREGANCVCIHLEENEQARLNIETDLRQHYEPPCNRQ